MWVIAAIGGLCFAAYLVFRGRPNSQTNSFVIPPDDAISTVYGDGDGEGFFRINFTGTRPAGKWVNWQIGSGQFDVAGTFFRHDAVKGFAKRAEAAQANGQSLGVFLKEDPNNATDPNAIQVYGWTISPSNMTLLGFVPKPIAAEAAIFMKSVPVAAELKRIAIGDKGAFITIAGLWPPVKARKDMWLNGGVSKVASKFFLHEHEVVQITALIEKMNATKPITMSQGAMKASSKAGLATGEGADLSQLLIGDDASVQAIFMSKMFDQWTQAGTPVPPGHAMRLADTLSKARRPDIEKQFLAAWCRHFPEGRGAIYAELVERAQKCGAISNV